MEYTGKDGNKYELPQNTKFIFVTGCEGRQRTELIIKLNTLAPSNCKIKEFEFPENGYHPSHHLARLSWIIKSICSIETPIRHAFIDIDGQYNHEDYSHVCAIVETVSPYILQYVPIVQSILHAYIQRRDRNPRFPNPISEQELELLNACNLINEDGTARCSPDDFVILNTSSNDPAFRDNYPVYDKYESGDIISYYDGNFDDYDDEAQHLTAMYIGSSLHCAPSILSDTAEN